MDSYMLWDTRIHGTESERWMSLSARPEGSDMAARVSVRSVSRIYQRVPVTATRIRVLGYGMSMGSLCDSMAGNANSVVD